MKSDASSQIDAASFWLGYSLRDRHCGSREQRSAHNTELATLEMDAQSFRRCGSISSANAVLRPAIVAPGAPATPSRTTVGFFRRHPRCCSSRMQLPGSSSPASHSSSPPPPLVKEVPSNPRTEKLKTSKQEVCCWCTIVAVHCFDQVVCQGARFVVNKNLSRERRSVIQRAIAFQTELCCAKATFLLRSDPANNRTNEQYSTTTVA